MQYLQKTKRKSLHLALEKMKDGNPLLLFLLLLLHANSTWRKKFSSNWIVLGIKDFSWISCCLWSCWWGVELGRDRAYASGLHLPRDHSAADTGVSDMHQILSLQQVFALQYCWSSSCTADASSRCGCSSWTTTAASQAPFSCNLRGTSWQNAAVSQQCCRNNNNRVSGQLPRGEISCSVVLLTLICY